jgi:hypothetical protein
MAEGASAASTGATAAMRNQAIAQAIDDPIFIFVARFLEQYSPKARAPRDDDGS